MPTPILDDKTSYNSGATSSDSHSFSHTTGSIKKGAIIVVVASGSNRTHDGVTYGGVAMTKVDEVASSSYFRLSIWRLLAPAAGANNVVITLSGAGKVAAVASTWAKVDQVNPISAHGNNTGSDAGPETITIVTDRAGSAVVDGAMVNHNSGGQTKDASQTLLATVYQSSDTWNCGSSYKAVDPAGSCTMQWTFGSSDTWHMVAVELVGSKSGNPFFFGK